MNFLQEHPRLATAGAIVIAAGVVALLYALSLVNKPEPGSTTTAGTAATILEPVTPAAADGQGQPLGGPGDPLEQYDYAGLLDLSDGQALESIFTFDIDSDGTGEALVLVRGEGDGRPLDWYLFDAGGSQPSLLFERKSVAQGEVAIDGPRIVETEAVYTGQDDACCPSSLKRTTFVWKDGGLVVASVVAQPPGAPAP